MRRLIAAAVTLLLLAAGCGSDGPAGPSGEAEQPGYEIPEGAEKTTIEGVTVYVDEDERMIYTEDCDLAERITEEGEEYGPVPRNDDGSGGETGYGSICSD
jgi:hypothetical protein